jgi:hypothetical protein
MPVSGQMSNSQAMIFTGAGAEEAPTAGHVRAFEEDVDVGIKHLPDGGGGGDRGTPTAQATPAPQFAGTPYNPPRELPAAASPSPAFSLDDVTKMVHAQMESTLERMQQDQHKQAEEDRSQREQQATEKQALVDGFARTQQEKDSALKVAEMKLERLLHQESSEREARMVSDRRAAEAEVKLKAEEDRRRTAEADAAQVVADKEAELQESARHVHNTEAALKVVTEAKERAQVEIERLQREAIKRQAQDDAHRVVREEVGNPFGALLFRRASIIWG